ncbi:uncharacterized protein [Salminus brasiliensis]|uniref:uncharacterized protein n=1 Tax=Salminus brasiliensis TaxID=930266 RepID=UPI003B831C42
MMLLLGLFFSSLFCSVYTLQCQNCQRGLGQCSVTTSAQCQTGSACAAARISLDTSLLAGNTSVFRTCLDKNACTLLNATASGVTFSAELGVINLFAFFSCCETDNCNNNNIPEPDTIPNGLKCATCNSLTDTVCNTTLSCVGNQNRCANGTVSAVPIFGPITSRIVKGCVSKSFCDATQFAKISCCTGNMCNGSDAWLRLDLGLFLMVLMTTILLQ